MLRGADFVKNLAASTSGSEDWISLLYIVFQNVLFGLLFTFFFHYAGVF